MLLATHALRVRDPRARTRATPSRARRAISPRPCANASACAPSPPGRRISPGAARSTTTSCASCHGATGLGDGAAGESLDPPPRNFHERERLRRALALRALQHHHLRPRRHRHAGVRTATRRSVALGPHVLRRGTRVRTGRDRARQGAARRPSATPPSPASPISPRSRIAPSPSLREATPTATALRRVSCARTPKRCARGDLPLDLAARKLAHSLEAYRAGERERALDLAISSYLDGFEHGRAGAERRRRGVAQEHRGRLHPLPRSAARRTPARRSVRAPPRGGGRARAGRAATRRRAASARRRCSPAR